MRTAPWLRHFGVPVATGTILFLFSERLFWAALRPNDTWRDLAMTWLVYLLSGYLFLTILYALRVNGRPALFLAGTAYGWLVEGIWATTLYGSEPSAPFPLSILITGISWHALIAVMAGWYGARVILASWEVRGAFQYAAVAGLFWGLWAPYAWNDSSSFVAPVIPFFLHAAAGSLLFALSHWLLGVLRLDQFRPNRIAVGIVILVHLAWFVAGPLRQAGILSTVVLFPLLALVLGLLWLARDVRAERLTVLEEMSRPVKPQAHLALLVIPLVATATYGIAYMLQMVWLPFHTLFFVATAAAGGFLFLQGIWKTVLGIPRKRVGADPT